MNIETLYVQECKPDRLLQRIDLDDLILLLPQIELLNPFRQSSQLSALTLSLQRLAPPMAYQLSRLPTIFLRSLLWSKILPNLNSRFNLLSSLTFFRLETLQLTPTSQGIDPKQSKLVSVEFHQSPLDSRP